MNTLVVGPDRAGFWVAVEGDRIAAVGHGTPPPARESLRSDDCIIEPGRVNAHTHLYGALAAFGLPPPLPEPKSFLEILERFWWRLDAALDPAMLRAAARLYVAEALLAGTTSLVDHHESPGAIEGSLDVIADACDELGIRALVCYGATERNAGRDEARRGLDECRRFARENHRQTVRGLVGLHASFTVSDETIRDAAELCGSLGTVLHVHVAEDLADVRDAERRGFVGPLERLDELGALVPGSILAHGVTLDARQVARADERRIWIVQNPRSNANNRVGHPRHLERSTRVALGTDGFPSDMLVERRALIAPISSEEALRRFEGSRRLMSERFDRSFELSPGAAADFIAVDARGVRDVIVGGRRVVVARRLVSGDVDSIRDRARSAAARLANAMNAERNEDARARS